MQINNSLFKGGGGGSSNNNVNDRCADLKAVSAATLSKTSKLKVVNLQILGGAANSGGMWHHKRHGFAMRREFSRSHEVRNFQVKTNLRLVSV